MSALWRGLLTSIILVVLVSVQASAEEVGNTKKHIEPIAKKRNRSTRKAVSRQAETPIVLRNLWTREVLPLVASAPPIQATVSEFLRCHYTGQQTHIHPKLIDVVLKAARRFGVRIAEIISGYRSPKYNMLLRKKGREVAANSQHPKGDAIDFRLIGVPVRKLVQFVRTLRLGGVGYYEESRFVHADLRGPTKGRLPYWTGQ